MENKTAFVTYSWDSEEHQGWVYNLTNELRKNGVDAKLDIFFTQAGTVNLNKMMVSNMRESDYVIVVLTEEYANRSDNFKGGVGFESILSLTNLNEDPDKFIFINRHNGDFNKVFPFHLKGYYAIDFSKDSNYNESFKELLHKIHKIPMYEMAPLGNIPDLSPSNFNATTPAKESLTNPILDLKIPNLKQITDKDKDFFISNAYRDIRNTFNKLFSDIKTMNSNFEYSDDTLTNAKNVFTLYLNGEKITGVKLWLSNNWGEKSIKLSYNNHSFDFDNDNSYNESIICIVDQDNNLKLQMTMNMFGNRDATTVTEIVKQIWENNLSYHLP